MEALDSILREALVVVAILALPLLALATLVGTVVAVAQAATQVQEQTLTLLPKLVCVGVAIAAFGRFGMELCVRLFVDAIRALPAIVRAGP